MADDLEVLGLRVSPDLDSILYTLTGRSDEERGWGRADESWRALESVGELGGDDWFRLGDRDIGLHLVRTELLRAGVPLSEATARIAERLGLGRAALAGDRRSGAHLSRDTCRDVRRSSGGSSSVVTRTRSMPSTTPARPMRRRRPGVLEAIAAADVILIAPSNPYVSIGPILAVAAIREALERRSVPCVAVSPLVGGRAVKGPADRMLLRLAGGTSPAHVAGCYDGLIDALVVDESDDATVELPAGVRRVVTQTLMTDLDAARRLASVALDSAGAPA